MGSVFVTGGSGFLGSLLVEHLLAAGRAVVSFEVVPSPVSHRDLRCITGDLRNRILLEASLTSEPFEAVFHCGAMLAHCGVRDQELWSSNVEGTRNLAESMKAARIPAVVYTSSNCL